MTLQAAGLVALRRRLLAVAAITLVTAGHASAAALPGAAVRDAGLTDRLARALASQGPGYLPRTRHVESDGRPRYTNRLILESSPYLRQHAHNPVDWYPWGAEALETARRLDRPIFLSIGYSTCHWCHVMEEESFDDESIARVLNEGFVAVKVDREQRPDLDEVYMTAVNLISGRGGWPMSSFLTPDGEPFYGATYFPPQLFAALLARVSELWRNERSELDRIAGEVTAQVRVITAARGAGEAVGQQSIERAISELLATHDAMEGGFGAEGPKFPREPELLLLLDESLRGGGPEVLEALLVTLDAMAAGGIYDHVGGGFHRYATDPGWLVPHFEKMLYNQAQLARVYALAHFLTGRERYARVARQTLDYVLRDMRDPAGGFYSATDADSEGEEGTFFLWTPADLVDALGTDDGAFAAELWGVTEAGNFEGASILHLPRDPAEIAAAHGMSLAVLHERVDDMRERLYHHREARPHPLRDEKILTEWNGLMITALARAAEILDEPRYLDAAREAAEFLWRASRRDDGTLWRVHLAGLSGIDGQQSDYSHLAEGLLALYDATADRRWLDRATELAGIMEARFWDETEGGFFMSEAAAAHRLIARPKSSTDNALPSGNAVAAAVLTMLAQRLGERRYRDRADATIAAFSSTISRYPSGHAYMLIGARVLAEGDAGTRQYAASGKVRVELDGTPDGRVVIDLDIAPGWHVNAHQPLGKSLVATEVLLPEGAAVSLEKLTYPEAEMVTLGFQPDPLAVYQGAVRIAGRVSQVPESAAPVTAIDVRLQACNDQVCLLPENVRLELPLAALAGRVASGRPG